MMGGRCLAGLIAGWIFLVAPTAFAQQAQEAVSQSQPKTDARSRAKIHTELGSLYFENGNSAVALEEAKIAIEADSGYAPGYVLRGLVYFFLKENVAAEEDLRKAHNLAPGDPEINNNYGWFLCQTGREKQAMRHFTNAIQNTLYATPDRAYINAGVCAVKMGDLSLAEDYFLRALQTARDGAPMAKVQLAGLHLRRGKLLAAQRMVEEGLQQMAPPTAEALWLGIKIQRLAGDKAHEGDYAALLRRLYPASREYQEFLKGNFE